MVAPADAVPEQATPRPGGTLARGEATGHSHRFEVAGDVQLFDYEGIGYVRVNSDSARLIHDEHAPIHVPRGIFRFWMQREYSPEEIRRIVD
jgi:hypothetical protein